jgi:hypothetical protein
VQALCIGARIFADIEILASAPPRFDKRRFNSEPDVTYVSFFASYPSQCKYFEHVAVELAQAEGVKAGVFAELFIAGIQLWPLHYTVCEDRIVTS